ncbi:MAG TPA: hypothetical protein VJ697_04150 [Nitrososphaeraceae archaeon]|nr:hypothetical protein [Nitrososphaeraceae archaeon]
MTNSNGDITAIKIMPGGWKIENNPPRLCRRYSNQLPHISPTYNK